MELIFSHPHLNVERKPAANTVVKVLGRPLRYTELG